VPALPGTVRVGVFGFSPELYLQILGGCPSLPVEHLGVHIVKKRLGVCLAIDGVQLLDGLNSNPQADLPFHMDLRPVSNREFLAFVRSHPAWKKSQIGKDLHDGDYLKRWEGDEAIKPAELDRPVFYVSFYAALSYCESSGKDLPKVYEYRVAASNTLREGIFVEYEKSYKASKFDFSLPDTFSKSL
jgi:hypothetical protein